MIPTYGCPFCGHTLDKLHRVQSTTACWVECSRCRARGPAADTVDEAVKAWDRWATVAPRALVRLGADRQATESTREADEAQPRYDLPPPPPRHRYMTPKDVARSVEWRATMTAAADRVILTGKPAELPLPEEVFDAGCNADIFWMEVGALLEGTGWTLANHPHKPRGHVLESLRYPNPLETP